MADGQLAPQMSLQSSILVDGYGRFNKIGAQQFLDRTISAQTANYQVVSILGPQSSGKSTLLNRLFGTEFMVMDAVAGRGMTTVGILWSVSPVSPTAPTIVLDVEGTDARDRKDSNFERKLATFALSISDHILVNLWCHDIGRRQATGRELMKITFQVYLNKFTDNQRTVRRNITFVIRDRTRSPDHMIIASVEAEVAEVWAEALPPWLARRRLQDYFVVNFVLMDNYEERPEAFEQQVNELRSRFRALRTGAQRVPARDLAVYADSLWAVIQSDQHLNLPDRELVLSRLRTSELRKAALQVLRGHALWPGNTNTTNVAFTSAIMSAAYSGPQSFRQDGGRVSPSPSRGPNSRSNTPTGQLPPRHAHRPSQGSLHGVPEQPHQVQTQQRASMERNYLTPADGFGKNATVAILEALRHYDTESVYYSKEAYAENRAKLLEEMQQATVDAFVTAIFPLTRRDLLQPARVTYLAAPPHTWPQLQRMYQRHERAVADVARRCQQGWQVPAIAELKDGSVMTWNVMNRVKFEMKDMMISECQFVLDKMKNRFDAQFVPVNQGEHNQNRAYIRRYVRQGLLDGLLVLTNLAVFQLDATRYGKYNSQCQRALKKLLTDVAIDPDDPQLVRRRTAAGMNVGRTPMQERLMEQGDAASSTALLAGRSHVDILEVIGWDTMDQNVKITTGEACQEAWDNLWSYSQLRMNLAVSSDTVTNTQRAMESARARWEIEQRELRDRAMRGPRQPNIFERSWADFTKMFKKDKNIFTYFSNFGGRIYCWMVVLVSFAFVLAFSAILMTLRVMLKGY